MANAQEHELHYPLGDRLPAPGEALEVAPGVRWVRMGLPFALDHINLWLLLDRDADGREGWALVDSGLDNPATRAAWAQVFATGLDGLPILRVFATHMHPDHLGLAHWLCRHWSDPARPLAGDCRLWISATDWSAARAACRGGDAADDADAGAAAGEAAAAFYARHGLTDPEALAQVRARGNYYRSLVPTVPARYRRLMDGQRIDIDGQPWQAISGYGHAPEHIALHGAAAGVLISGDMLLPRISTNVSVFELEPEADPLPLFLQSIDKFLPLPGDTLVLPSHGKPFRGLQARVRQLHQHHAHQLDAVLSACAQAPCSAAELLPVLFMRALDLHQTTFAMGEAVAHLHALHGQGRLRAATGTDGVLRFSA